jgi:hypothetical protein
MVKKERDFTCQHIKKKQDKSIYIFHLINRDLCICEKCGAKLMKQVIEQDKVEKEAKFLITEKPNGFLKTGDKIVKW